MFQFCGADRTGRFAGRGPQPQNLPNSGPNVNLCECGNYYKPFLNHCPKCHLTEAFSEPTEWDVSAVNNALSIISTGDLSAVENQFGDATAAVAGCLRGLFCAAPGHDLICSDYSAIEAVVLAMLAKEQWRIDVFKTHGKIYEMSAAKISGVAFQEFLDHKERTGNHHPLRKKIGKVSELASGYQGGMGAWKRFGADQHLTDQEIKDAIKSWRRESPNIVNFWYGLERAAIAAIQSPGEILSYNGISYQYVKGTLNCRLLSGRILYYHSPLLMPDVTPWGKPVLKISYMGWNSESTKGPIGWMRIDTYGGKLCENVVQATARDILTFALVNVEKAGYPAVMHVHDEIVSEVPQGAGSVENFEAIMATLPEWAKGWPIRAAGGWRGKRYRKD
jgi:DNA polymerase